nr:MAG TPA: hypothetical protein [Caudoviricetes sp.]
MLRNWRNRALLQLPLAIFLFLRTPLKNYPKTNYYLLLCADCQIIRNY